MTFIIFSLKDAISGLSPLLFRKLSNPDIFSSTGKTKLQRQLSQDDCKLRRGSLASSLSGKYLILFFKKCGTVLLIFKGILTASSLVVVLYRTLRAKAVIYSLLLCGNTNLLNQLIFLGRLPSLVIPFQSDFCSLLTTVDVTPFDSFGFLFFFFSHFKNPFQCL